MLDNGFSLSRVELLNWGNFHGYQKFQLRDRALEGPLFNPPAASAILGVNGSGKSTLIDALMIALLPFEGSLKLGVTHDLESGSSGGRTIRDYVLGKHSSNSGLVSDPESIFGRKEGCTFVLLHFTHNKQKTRDLTLGRVWWYQNYKVSETQVAFLSYDKLSIQDFCPEGKTPPMPKVFRQHLKVSHPNVQVFETMTSYFTAACQALGKISRDDLKILNRAFFVKSISNIDQFIRENMLLEQESPNLDRLMENVRNGQEIAFTIETCLAKIAAIGRILKELKKLVEFDDSARALNRQLHLLSLHREWSEWRDLLKQKEVLTSEIAEIESRLPLIKKNADDAVEKSKAAQRKLLSEDVEARISSIDRERKLYQDKILWSRQILEKWQARAKTLGVKLPSGRDDWKIFVEGIDTKIEVSSAQITLLSKEIEGLREKKILLEKECAELREDLKHIENNKTLIPRDLHSIRQNAVQDLNIPPRHLLFVGELIQVKPEFSQMRTAIESALFPISRNLLCHPEDLHRLTRWLDDEGLRADVTVKRIELSELETDGEFPPSVAFSPNSILSMMEVRPDRDQPFYHYLWRWLRSTFDYELVNIKEFKSKTAKCVTREGLVKKDKRTMRKLKVNFSFSLGWDNSDMIAELTGRLVKLNAEYEKHISVTAAKKETLAFSEDLKRHYLEIKEGYQNIINLESDVSYLKELESEKHRLLESNPDYQALSKLASERQVIAQELVKGVMSLESDLASKRSTAMKVEGLIPSRREALQNSKPFRDLCLELGGEDKLQENLVHLDVTLLNKGMTRLQLDGELKSELQKVEQSRGRAISMAAVNLGNYRYTFNDPNLPYDLGSGLPVPEFLKEWLTAEERLQNTDLPSAQEKWKRFFDQVLLDSVKDMINEIKSRIHEISETVRSINDVLKLTNFEDLPTEKRYLRIDIQTSDDDRIRKFRKNIAEVEKTLSPMVRAQIESQSQVIMAVLTPFVEEFQKDTAYRAFATDVRNHFHFGVQSLRRSEEGDDTVVEVFSGARRDAKSSAQTTQLAYALLASCLAYRFHFHDPVAGADTPRLIVLDEFGGKFDNEKPREIMKLLEKMGFQSIIVSPMSKADLLADGIGQLVLVHKVSAFRSKVQSYALSSREDYERLLSQTNRLSEGQLQNGLDADT